MAYVKQTWENFPSTSSPLEASRLNHLETQYEEAVSYADEQIQGVEDAIERIPVDTSDLVGELRYPAIIAHRGSPHVFPEHSIEAYRKSYESGFSPEPDVRALSDGTLVCVHDATTTRTMDISKNVSATTPDEWRAATINPPSAPTALSGSGRGTPVFFEDFLNEFGGKCVLWPEIKDGSAASAVISAVTSRGLQNSVVLQSFSLSVCQEVVAAGCHALFLTSSGDPAAIANAGVEFVGVNYANATNQFISDLKAANLKVFAYTVNSFSVAEAQWSRGVDGIFSDNPWAVTTDYPVKNFLDLKDGFLPLGTIHSRGKAGLPAPSNTVVSRNNGLEFFTSETGQTSNAIRIGQFGVGGPSATLRLKAQSYSNVTTDNNWLFGLYLGEQAGGDPVDESDGVDGRWRLAMVRRTGVKLAYNKPTFAGDITNLGSAPAPGSSFISSEGVTFPMEFEVTFTPSSIRIRNLTLGDEELLATHSAWTGNSYYLTLSCNGSVGRVWDVSCTR